MATPRKLSVALSGVLERTAPKTTLAAVQLAWPRAAGERIARVAEPVSERDGVVTITCSSASWAEQLDLLQNDLLERLNAEVKPELRPNGLRFRTGGTPGNA